MASATIVWFRQDLRLQDNAALAAAAARGPIVPAFLWCPEEEGTWAPGGASKWWLHEALRDLGHQLARHHQVLVLRQGPSALSLLRELFRETGADALYWNRRYEPAIVARDVEIKRELRKEGWEIRSYNSQLLREPSELATQQGKPFQVYTPFSRAFLKLRIPQPVADLPVLSTLPDGPPESETLESLQLLPAHPWYRHISQHWEPTRKGAETALTRFLDQPVTDYDTGRDFPGQEGTSRLSPYLHWGQIGPREVWAATEALKQSGDGLHTFRKELIWREFAHHVLFHFPKTPEAPLRDAFKAFPWEKDSTVLDAWKKGQTGYPIVDAGMRQLWQTGWMHNRVRMIAASLLVKHFLQPWQEGARWFWDTLVDADLAANTLGWQWSAGCGADAAPYFRVFNPVTQGEKFDPDGAFTRRFVPELQLLPNRYLFAPWEAPSEVLETAGVILGETYPRPPVLPSEGRERALQAFSRFKEVAG